MATPLILDTDIGTDVDDALALALALRHPDIDLRAITTVSGDTQRRARIAASLLRIAGRDDVEVAAGVRGDEHPNRRSEAGHEDAMLAGAPDDLRVSERDAISLLLDECEGGEVSLCTVGMQSNVAAALERDPSFASTVPQLTVMGGLFAPVRFLDNPLPAAVDHNLNVDQQASLRALNAAFEDVVYVPCDVTFGAWLTRRHLDALRAGDALCRELARQIEIWSRHLMDMGRGAIPEEYVCERRFVVTEQLPVTVALHRGAVRTFVDPAEGREATVVRSVDAAAFAEWFTDVVRG
jgi:purine nucleosidase